MFERTTEVQNYVFLKYRAIIPAILAGFALQLSGCEDHKSETSKLPITLPKSAERYPYYIEFSDQGQGRVDRTWSMSAEDIGRASCGGLRQRDGSTQLNSSQVLVDIRYDDADRRLLLCGADSEQFPITYFDSAVSATEPNGGTPAP